jgi:DNA repair photolyase
MLLALIYEPAGRAREYAPLALNVYRGCDHACVYCYAPAATYARAADFAASSARWNLIGQLDAELGTSKLRRGQVLMSFTCDPYQQLDSALRHTRSAIEVLHRHGFRVCTLTKGGSRALGDIDLFGRGDAYAASLTFLDPSDSRQWEPSAALPADRIATLAAFHQSGIATWASLEPVIDPQQSLALIESTHHVVDLYKIGKLNHHPAAKTIDWRAWGNAAVALLERLGKRYYVKDDLRAYVTIPTPTAISRDRLDAELMGVH